MSIKLQGLRLLNTRPIAQNLTLSHAILKAGGISIDLPALEIRASSNYWIKKLPKLDKIQHAIFISANAVDVFYSTLKQQQLIWCNSINIIAIGKASAAALARWHLYADIPSAANSNTLLDLMSLKFVQNQNILLIKGWGGSNEISNTLKQRGANLIELKLYKRILPIYNPNYIQTLWRNEIVNTLLFTSQQSIHNILILFGENALPWLYNTPCVVISERLARLAFNLGMRKIIIANYEDLIYTLIKYQQDYANNAVLFWHPKSRTNL